jgi:hypothetical protein
MTKPGEHERRVECLKPTVMNNDSRNAMHRGRIFQLFFSFSRLALLVIKQPSHFAAPSTYRPSASMVKVASIPTSVTLAASGVLVLSHERARMSIPIARSAFAVSPELHRTILVWRAAAAEVASTEQRRHNNGERGELVSESSLTKHVVRQTSR